MCVLCFWGWTRFEAVRVVLLGINKCSCLDVYGEVCWELGRYTFLVSCPIVPAIYESV